jgi:hypothetical protein
MTNLIVAEATKKLVQETNLMIALRITVTGAELIIPSSRRLTFDLILFISQLLGTFLLVSISQYSR